MQPPLVSVVLMTYQHASFIREAVAGVLAQQAPFGFELLITEDASTDGTREIVEEIAAEEPERVRLLLSPRNLNTNEVYTRAFDAARGAFLAYLDGDDFWTSPRKLHDQVAALEAHPEIAMCFHPVEELWEDGRREVVRTDVDVLEPTRFIHAQDPIASCSTLFRRSTLPRLPSWFVDAPITDLPLYLLLASQGPFLQLPEPMGVWRRHGKGLYSSATTRWRRETTLRCLRLAFGDLSAELQPPTRRRIGHLELELAALALWERHPLAAARHLGGVLRWDPTSVATGAKRAVQSVRKVHERSAQGPG